MLLSAYAPVQTTGACSPRTTQFYEQLSTVTKEAQQRGDWVIIGGGMNTSIKTENAPGLIGKWASNKVSANSEAMVNFMMEHQMAALNTFQQTQWRSRYTWSRGLSRTMIDFFLGLEHMIRDHYGPRDKKVVWNMQSDHRVIQMTLLGDQAKKKKSWTPPRKNERSTIQENLEKFWKNRLKLEDKTTWSSWTD